MFPQKHRIMVSLYASQFPPQRRKPAGYRHLAKRSKKQLVPCPKRGRVGQHWWVLDSYRKQVSRNVSGKLCTIHAIATFRTMLTLEEFHAGNTQKATTQLRSYKGGERAMQRWQTVALGIVSPRTLLRAVYQQSRSAALVPFILS